LGRASGGACRAGAISLCKYILARFIGFVYTKTSQGFKIAHTAQAAKEVSGENIAEQGATPEGAGDVVAG
jgi:hypothetical protein